jgi:hypothetical protein
MRSKPTINTAHRGPSFNMGESDIDAKPAAIETDAVDWAASGLKLDPHGFPLHPQPSNDPRGKSISAILFVTP